MDKIKATAVGYGITEEFAQALHNFVDECLAVAEKKHKASHADTVWTTAMEGLAAHYTAKCEALQAECDKKDARIAKLRETVKVLEVNLSELAKQALPSKSGAINANPSQESADDNDDYIPWHGGDCPVPAGARIEVLQRCGRIVSGYALDWRFGYLTTPYWYHSNHPRDIVAYRAIK